MNSQFSSIISIVSLCIAMISVVYSITSNREKFLITSSERTNILNWYEKTNRVVTEVKERAKQNNNDSMFELLVELSSLIEVGRFYFPNIIKNDLFGDEKPSAYRGYRNIVLEFLVYIYEIGNRNDVHLYWEHINALQRHFTSRIFSILEPKKHISRIKKNSYISMSHEVVLADFLNETPYNYSLFNPY